MNMTDRGRSRRALASQRGVSLVETLVALGLFALTAGTMGSYLVQQIRHRREQLSVHAGLRAGRDKSSSRLRALRFSRDGAGLEDRAASATPPSRSPPRFSTTRRPTGMKQITVNVGWNDPQGPSNVAVQAIYTDVQHY